MVYFAIGALPLNSGRCPPVPWGPCTSDIDCRLNGACSAGRCECDRGWRGDHCEMLDLQVGSVAYGFGNMHSKNTSVWGGGPPVYDDDSKLYHLFVTEIAGHCGMSTWVLV